MKDPQRGWDPKEEVKNVDEDTTEWAVEDENKEAKAEWMEYLKNRRNQMRAMKENIFFLRNIPLYASEDRLQVFPQPTNAGNQRQMGSCPQEAKNRKSPKRRKNRKSRNPKKTRRKKSTKGKQKKEKKEKKPKKEKPKKLTKEEKAELARLKKEQERLEEERRKAEENRWFMFPLGEAATDEFFKDVFENWVRVEKGKKDKKGKKKK
ncbi:hypothetical protein NQ317_013856 [Molorchus minor]|uniref:Uncharacterized protein n=1 Tax=Molorchus minor TaxID=1323400 RepID=A0ABQ9K8L8_9CUCU|nr:hypothetical protein NQ317_013856 [Molorchus minor]